MPRAGKRARSPFGSSLHAELVDCDLPQRPSDVQGSLISALPEAVLVYNILSHTCLEPADLCGLMAVAKKLKALCEANDALLWSRHVQAGNIVPEAVRLAGSYRAYALQKRSSSLLGLSSAGWGGPCDWEVQASTNRVAAATQGADSSSLLFLLDGSGSVGDEEFDASTSFILRCARTAKAQSPNECKVQVVQFSTDVKDEWEDKAGEATDLDAFEKAVKGMVRMNGGTNIAAALTHAGKSLKQACEGVTKEAVTKEGVTKEGMTKAANVIVLITDGRVDGHQAREARQVASMLSDEQPTTTLFAYGVGRGIDRRELLHLVAAAPPAPSCKYQQPQDRYLDLFFKEEAPW